MVRHGGVPALAAMFVAELSSSSELGTPYEYSCTRFNVPVCRRWLLELATPFYGAPYGADDSTRHHLQG